MLSALATGALLWSGCPDKPQPPTELPGVAVNDITRFEGDDLTDFVFQIGLLEASDQTVRITYETADGTAVAGEDYIATSGTVEISPGTTTAEVGVQVIGDTLREDDETFYLVLTGVEGAKLNTTQATAHIRNDDTFLPIDDTGYTTPDHYDGYTLVWADEFEGSQIDPDNWTHDIGGHGWGNNELQYYTDSENNSFLTQGKLVIEARKEQVGANGYTSARLITAHKQSFQFGRIDIRARLPKGKGIWPALWMLGDSFWTIGWPACGEIDIMELLGHEPNKVYGTAHWGPQGASTSQHISGSYTLSGGKDFSEEFHVFSIIWEPNKITWLVDDVPYHQLGPSNTGGNWPFNDTFFFLMNVAVGGNWPGNPDGTTQFPQRMYVDYVRVFQQ